MRVRIFVFVLWLSILFCLPLINASGEQTISIFGENTVVLFPEDTRTLSLQISSEEDIDNFSVSGYWASSHPGISANLSLPEPTVINITFSTTGATEGVYEYVVTVKDNVSSVEYPIEVIVSEYKLALWTDKESYQKGEKLCIYGDIVTFDNQTFSNKLKITLSSEGWKRYAWISPDGNEFLYIYNISYGDPEGIWNISIESGNVKVQKNISVSLPENIVKYKVTFLAPAKGAIYRRGDAVEISVLVSDVDGNVRNATVYCSLPPMNRLKLEETKSGFYKASYTIPWDADIGRWVLSVESIKSGDEVSAGGGSTYIEIKPASLCIELLEPSAADVSSFDNVNVKIRLYYKDGTPVEEANVVVNTSKGNKTLGYSGEGIYEGKLNITESKYCILSIHAVDPYGNTATFEKIIYLAEKKNEIRINPLFFSIGMPIIGVITAVGLHFMRRSLTLRRLQDIQRELEEIRRLQRETVERYYKEGSISRKTYDALMADYAKTHDTLMEEYAKKLAKIKKKKSST